MSNTGDTSWGSPTPQGQGWWQASDGLWYPPQGQSGAVAAPPQPPAPAYQAPAPAYQPPAPAYPAPAPPAYLHGTAQPVAGPGYVDLSYVGPVEKVGRLRPFYVFFLAIPQFLSLIVTSIVAAFSTYAAVFGILLMGRVHPRSHDNIVKAHRAQWRLMTFTMCWRNQAPGPTPAGAIDPGDDLARLSIAYGGEGLNRLGPLIKMITTIPALIVLFFAMIGAYIQVLIGLVNVVLKGEFPQAQRDKVIAVWRRAVALAAYQLLTDVKPPG